MQRLSVPTSNFQIIIALKTVAKSTFLSLCDSTYAYYVEFCWLCIELQVMDPNRVLVVWLEQVLIRAMSYRRQSILLYPTS